MVDLPVGFRKRFLRNKILKNKKRRTKNMFFPGAAKTIPSVPENLREAVIMAVRITEGKIGKKVELVGSRPTRKGCADIKYRTKDFTDTKEVEQQTKEIQSWVDNNQEQLKEALLFLKGTFEPMLKLAQKMGLGPKVS